MAIYEITAKELRRIEEGEFSRLCLKERSDLQRLRRTQINTIAEDLYVLAEEFSEWEKRKRRIDLLALDSDANLVVVELKRTNDGGTGEHDSPVLFALARSSLRPISDPFRSSW